MELDVAKQVCAPACHHMRTLPFGAPPTQGVAELEAQYAGQEEVQFTDRLLFLVGRKKELGAAAAGGGAPAAAGAVPAAGEAAAAAEQAGTPGGAAAAAAAGSSPGAAPPAAPRQPPRRHQLGAAPPVPRLEVLTPGQRRQYAERGFAGPLRVLSADEAAAAAVRYDRYAAALGGGVSGDYRFKSHLLLPWVRLWGLVERRAASLSPVCGGGGTMSNRRFRKARQQQAE